MVIAIIIMSCQLVVACILFAVQYRSYRIAKNRTIDYKIWLLKKIRNLCDIDQHDYFNDLFNQYGRDYQLTEEGNVCFPDSYFTLDELSKFYDGIIRERMNGNCDKSEK